MTDVKPVSRFYADYDLAALRLHGPLRSPAPHQNAALERMYRWFDARAEHGRGGILVLPTGGGKTFTAAHFACRRPVSEGSKVLWLAHTHHLLEQAFASFAGEAGLISEPKTGLRVRVVSGMQGEHFPVHTIRPTDDVVMCSLPTACRAFKEAHEMLIGFLDAAQGRLLVVFDEAHHAPAPSHRRLLRELRERHPGLVLLGLTATPTYGNERKQGWLAELFPQGIVHQVTAAELMAAGVLAKPVLHEERTAFAPDFNDREYRKWLGTHRDLPEDIVNALATNQQRNNYIVATYVNQRGKWGKTIVFADRWYQCDYLREAFLKAGVRADVVYAHVDADPGSAAARNRRGADENTRVLRAFKSGQLDVLINVKMLTEGTDVPDVQSVFLTRQSTSRILLTQMVGRALRGPKFGGTAEAHIVSFIDDWKQRINWASYDQLAAGDMAEEVREWRKRPPVHLISIELVRRLARQMDSGNNVNPAPYRQFLPVGWYLAEYVVRVQGTDDEEAVREQVMVFDHSKAGYLTLLHDLASSDLDGWKEYDLTDDDVQARLESWRERHFAGGADHIGSELRRDMLALARHMAQNDRHPPLFIPFDLRTQHDLDALAHKHLEDNLGALQAHAELRKEYGRKDRHWSVFYPTYGSFKSHYDGCVNRLVGLISGEHTDPPGPTTPETPPDREPSEDIKRQVKARDGKHCLCCGATSPLQVDHIKPWYLGGTHDLDNLQTLCKYCNRDKGICRIDFRKSRTPLKAPLTSVEVAWAPSGEGIKDPEQWEMSIRATLNFFYRAAAVDSVEIGQRGERFHHWRATLRPGNDPSWLNAHLAGLVDEIRRIREGAGYAPAPQDVAVS